jgi:hypothetical protein
MDKLDFDLRDLQEQFHSDPYSRLLAIRDERRRLLRAENETIYELVRTLPDAVHKLDVTQLRALQIVLPELIKKKNRQG